jgi:tetratricopeptide (TPR) repeat protein
MRKDAAAGPAGADTRVSAAVPGGSALAILDSARAAAAANPAVAASRFRTARELYRTAGDATGVTSCSEGLWKLWMGQSAFARAEIDINGELVYAKAREQHNYLALAHGALAWIHVRSGALDRAVAEFHLSIAAYRAAGYGAAISVSQLNLAELLRYQERLAEARAVYSQVRAQAEDEQNQAMGAAAIAGLASTCELEDPQTSKLYKQAMAVFRSAGMDKHAAECELRLATALQASGQLKLAAAAATTATASMSKAGDLVDSARAGMRMTSVLVQAQQLREAEMLIERIQGVFDHIGKFDLSARCDIARAIVWDRLSHKSHVRPQLAHQILGLMLPALLYLDDYERAQDFAANRRVWEAEQHSWFAWALRLAYEAGDRQLIAEMVEYCAGRGINVVGASAAAAARRVGKRPHRSMSFGSLDPFKPSRISVLDRPAPNTIGHLLRSLPPSRPPVQCGAFRLLAGSTFATAPPAVGAAVLAEFRAVAARRYVKRGVVPAESGAVAAPGGAPLAGGLGGSS